MWDGSTPDGDIREIRDTVKEWHTAVFDQHQHLKACPLKAKLQTCEHRALMVNRCQVEAKQLREEVQRLKAELDAMIYLLGDSLSI